MVFYRDWGFSQPPFQTKSLPADALGERLLVGRADELAKIKRRIQNGPRIVTVEGEIGIGKTSVVNVAAFQLFRDYINNGEGSFIIPCSEIFQLTPDTIAEEFIDHVYREVAQTLIQRAAIIGGTDRNLNVPTLDRINKWLNAPQISSLEAGAFGFNFSSSGENNSSTGFDRSGFRQLIRSWLKDLFVDEASEGIICVIDNLELLQTSERARTIIETFRDTLFNVPGLKWVLCGASGIFFGVASSKRLAGRLHAPVEIQALTPDIAPQIIESRVRAFALPQTSPYMPLLVEDFDRLYNILRGNLRDVLGDADNYCQWIADRALPRTEEEKRAHFTTWLNDRCEAAYRSIASEVRPRAFKVFRTAVELDGIFSPSDHAQFGFETSMAFDRTSNH
ncbi:hypothetical protein GCM10022280_17660 [Sphingomonas swuensis]|uniref:Orc1-like AAA ATPase domain-containing protein n=1 Tax=Sphingomonas swuensis TaxID=977800 RepID=A0ABP7SYZ8_9SPHN